MFYCSFIAVVFDCLLFVVLICLLWCGLVGFVFVCVCCFGFGGWSAICCAVWGLLDVGFCLCALVVALIFAVDLVLFGVLRLPCVWVLVFGVRYFRILLLLYVPLCDVCFGGFVVSGCSVSVWF